MEYGGNVKTSKHTLHAICQRGYSSALGRARKQSWGSVVSSTVSLIPRDRDRSQIPVKKSSTSLPFCREFHDVYWVPNQLTIGSPSSIKLSIKSNQDQHLFIKKGRNIRMTHHPCPDHDLQNRYHPLEPLSPNTSKRKP